MWAPSFLAVTITPSMLPSCAEFTTPEIAGAFWACAPAMFINAAAATADKSVEIDLPDIGPSLAGSAKKRIDSTRDNTQSPWCAKGGSARLVTTFPMLGLREKGLIVSEAY